MSYLLQYTENDKQYIKKFNSYYLAVTEKNNLFRRGVRALLYEPKVDFSKGFRCDDKHLSTVYTQSDLVKLSKLSHGYGIYRKRSDLGVKRVV